MNGVLGLRFCSFDIAKVSWKYKDERELHKASRKRLGMNKHQHGDAKILCLGTCLANLPPSPNSQETQTQV